MADRPNVETFITHHTLWHALTGSLPPQTLAPRPVSPAVLDSRDAVAGSLFIAFSGARTDGHNFIRQAVNAGAAAIICEERGLEQLRGTNAVLVDCRRKHDEIQEQNEEGRPDRVRPPHMLQASQFEPGRAIAYIVPDANTALQAAGAFQRLHRTHADLQVIGVTGSVGKTSTKELAASVLAQRYCTHRSTGNLNSEQGLPLALLGLRSGHERTVLEMGMYDQGEIRLLCCLARPHIGVVTNVGPTHLERLGTIDRIAHAKAELVEALPSAQNGGIAILNQDDPRVRAMAAATDARPFRFGLSAEADLWADEIESLGMQGIRFRIHHRQDDGNIHSQRLSVPILGRHSVYTALAAAAVGIVSHLSWQEISAGLQQAPSQLRLVVMPGFNGSTVIDDTYNASPVSTVAALNLLDDLFACRQAGGASSLAAASSDTASAAGPPRPRNGQHPQPQHAGRRIAILGDMRELGAFTEEGHKQVGAHAAAATDLLVTVGALGRLIADEAQSAGLPSQNVYATDDFETALTVLKELAQPHDLLLVKGSRAVGMDRLVAEISRQLASTAAPEFTRRNLPEQGVAGSLLEG